MTQRTLVVSNLYPSRREPTRGMFNYHAFRALSHHRELVLAAPMPWWTRWRRPAELLRAPVETHTGLTVRFPAFWSLPRIGLAHNAAAVLRCLRPMVRDQGPFSSILSAWAYPDAVAAVRLGRELSLPVVAMVLGSDINYFLEMPRLRQQITEGLRGAFRVVAVSEALRDRVLTLGLAPDRVVVQHNGVEGDRFRIREPAGLRQTLGLPLDRKIVCYVGNFRREKGVDLLIEAWHKLIPALTERPLLVMVGDGPESAAVRSRAAACSMDADVLLPGRRPHDEIPDWIGAADVFCLPSRNEGCPNVILEALASGRPVVAARVGGIPELIRPGAGGNGILVSPEDPVALAVGLRQALERTWRAEELRASVPCLSWAGFAATLDALLSEGERAARG